MNLINIILATVLIENILLNGYIGTHVTFFNNQTSKRILLLSGATIVVSSILSYLINILLIKYNIEFIQTLTFIIIIIFVHQIFNFIVKKYSHYFYEQIQKNLTFMTINISLIGVLLINTTANYNLIETITNSIFCLIGLYLISNILFSIKERLEQNVLSKTIKGYPIMLITLGIMSLLVTRLNIR